MKMKFLVLAAALLAVTYVSGRTLGDDVAQGHRSSSGDVSTTGHRIPIPGLVGSERVSFSVVVANDDDTDTLLVDTDLLAANITTMPDPVNNIETIVTAIPLLPGEKLTLDEGAQVVCLRAVTGVVAARLIVTKR